MSGGLRVIGYSADPVILEQIQDTSVGFVVNTKAHWIALRRKGTSYEHIDSLDGGKTSPETLDQIKANAAAGRYRSIIKVEFVGSYINPVPEEAPIYPQASVPEAPPAPAPAIPTAASIIERIVGPSVEPIPGPVPPPSPRLVPDEGLTPEENEIGQRARDESAEIARKIVQGIPGGPVPSPRPRLIT
jgi:hypothetical protein